MHSLESDSLLAQLPTTAEEFAVFSLLGTLTLGLRPEMFLAFLTKSVPPLCQLPNVAGAIALLLKTQVAAEAGEYAANVTPNVIVAMISNLFISFLLSNIKKIILPLVNKTYIVHPAIFRTIFVKL